MNFGPSIWTFLASGTHWLWKLKLKLEKSPFPWIVLFHSLFLIGRSLFGLEWLSKTPPLYISWEIIRSPAADSPSLHAHLTSYKVWVSLPLPLPLPPTRTQRVLTITNPSMGRSPPNYKHANLAYIFFPQKILLHTPEQILSISIKSNDLLREPVLNTLISITCKVAI